MVASIGSTSTDASGNTYKVVLADDFSNGYQTSNWGYAFNGGSYWNGAFTWSSSDVNVRNGEMQVTDTRHSDGSWTAGGFSSFKAGQTITYGTVEFDARVEQAQGTQAALLMWPLSDIWPGDGEIDILEAPQNQSMHSLHWADSNGNHDYSSIFSDFDPSQTHHYTMIWLPNDLTIKVDGVTVARWTDASIIPDTAMGFGAMGYVAAPGEAWLGGGPNGSTPSVVTTHLDNVVMSQWTGTGGTPTPVTPPPVVKPPVVVTPTVDTTPVVKTIGTGSDTLVLKISQDAYLAGAQYTVSVDGKQIGGTMTAGASFAAHQDDTITVKGDWAAGAHTVTVNFLNDAWGGTNATDRNLHVDGITYNGVAVAGGTGSLNANGPMAFGFTEVAAAPPPVVSIGTGAIPAKFGVPGTWGQDSQIWTGHLDFGGTSYETFGAKPAWGSFSTVQLAPTAWNATWDTHIAVDNALTTNLDLHAAGTRALDVMVVSAKGGSVILADGSDKFTWVAQNDGSGVGTTMMVKTGAGDDVVHITAAGLSSLADYDRTGNGSLYNATYDGTGSTVSIKFGAGHDTVTVDGGVRLVVSGGTGFATAVGGKANDVITAGTGGGDFTGGAGRDTFIFDRGDGHVTIEDFTSGSDRLKFMGLTKADVHMAAATEQGVSGMLVTYDSAGDSVFLAHVTKIVAADMLFA